MNLLRTTSQRLGQLQERKDSQGQLTRRDIATLLTQGNLALARAKAANLIQEDVMGDLLEELEMLVGVVGSHAGELEGNRDGKPLSPVLVEAAASIIHAAPSTESKDLNAAREILIQQLGPGFTRAVSASRNNYVSPRVMQTLYSPPPSALKMDQYLLNIAQTYGVQWAPERRRQDILNTVSEILDTASGSSPIVDLPRLRNICAQGLPDDPPWVRPRIWRLLFGTLPVLKTTWEKENQKQRDSYYDLVRRLLTPLATLPPPTHELSPTDITISSISESLSRLPPGLFVLLDNEPESAGLGICPLDPSARNDIRIECALNLDKRLDLIKSESSIPPCETPEIRLEPETQTESDPPSLTSPPATNSLSSRRHRAPTMLLSSKPYSAPPVHHTHHSSLLRLLYLHSALNPAIQSPHIPSLLVPLYSALVGEVEQSEAAHAEADTFWLFEALVGELGEMEEEEGGKVWMRKFSERIRWADEELAASLHSQSLDPALPHYSYRWLGPLLSQTVPLSSLFPMWDVIFACHMRTRDTNPKLEYLVDICTAFLIRARSPLFRLGKPIRKSPGLWSQEHTTLPPPSPLRPWELSDAFAEGMALLTSYPIDAAGGIDRILQTASDLAHRRIEAKEREKGRERENAGFGARIKQTMWKGFTNQVADWSPEEEAGEEEMETEAGSEDETGDDDDGNETETPSAPTFASRLADTMWRGITNQGSMEDDVPSPPSPSTPSPPTSPSPSPSTLSDTEKPLPVPSTPPTQTSLWGYAGKLKDSDTIAAFSKVSTNWRAKAMDAWGVRRGSNASASSSPSGYVTQGVSSPSSVASDLPPQKSGWPSLSGFDTPNHRRGSLGTDRENAMKDPPRPAVFRAPRESFLPLPRRQDPTALNSETPMYRDLDRESMSSLIHKTKASLASLPALQSHSAAPKSAPRPLMLNSRELITSKPPPPARSDGGTPIPRQSQWADVLLAKGHTLRQESMSSVSSLSPSDALSKPYRYTQSAGTGGRSDNDSDGASRKIPLNRRAVSPMALASRSPRLPWNADSPSGRSSDVSMTSPRGHPLSNGNTAEEQERAPEHAWRHFEEKTTATTGFDSPTTVSSPPIPPTPLTSTMSAAVCIATGGSGGHTGRTGSIFTINEASIPLEVPTQSKVLLRKKTPPPVRNQTDGESDTSEDSSLSRTPSAKNPALLRSKRYTPRPANLRIRENSPRASANTTIVEQKTPSPNSLAPEIATTPMAGEFSPNSQPSGASPMPRPAVRKTSGDNDGTRSRKGLADVRLRKVSTGSKEVRKTRDSGAEEGDDEGYDDLLSAYESEEGSKE
ncbi:regulator of Vps4 activity in the MVB pathway-domain-containing protein [Melanogaster broomeanus]|nr:regulator of Vps4 activity in the MVB pathway-domain-containing protein [Melanogaster broomeanus]